MRAIRLHDHLTQRRVAKRAGLSQAAYSRAERGQISGMTLDTLERIVDALGGRLAIDIRYRGGLGDRLIDAAHAALVDYVVGILRRRGWLAELEYSFNVFGDRGSVDILAWHAATRTLLIVEVKSRFTDLQAMLLALARKLRVVPDAVRRDRSWDPDRVGRIVVAYGTAENRTVVQRHAAMFDTALPARAIEIRRWLRSPTTAISGVWLVSDDVRASRSVVRP
ncbi:MAG TPA: helix-turn-helix transcriptional regulator [Candidatus Limnocylindrales bacterium]|nr:helix-turn-helix transcriptional regulator [Candidatus Limnocylindrales bacterium]